MNCITSASFNVLWNGSKTKEFKPSHDKHQGDPLSPYIFVLYIEKLTYIIYDAINNKSWACLKVGKNEPQISHLMFIHDLLLFGEAYKIEIKVIMKCLNVFYMISRQKVS